MAVLSENDRAEAFAEFMRALSTDRDPCPVLKADLRAALNGLDDFVHANAAAINAAIPQPARGALTSAQKARLLMFVIQKRYIKGA